MEKTKIIEAVKMIVSQHKGESIIHIDTEVRKPYPWSKQAVKKTIVSLVLIEQV